MCIRDRENVDDFVLQHMSKMLLNRDLLKIKMKNEPFPKRKIKEKMEQLKSKYGISTKEASYFVFEGEISNQAYSMEKETINLLTKSGKIVDVASANDQLNLEALSKTVVKYYLCFPKSIY